MNELPTKENTTEALCPLSRELDMTSAISCDLPRDFNVASYLLDRAAENWPDRVAMVSEETVLTFAQLDLLVNQAGNVLLNCGVTVEQRVIIMADRPIDFVALFLSAIKIGAVPVTLIKTFQPHELRYVIQGSRAVMAVVDQDMFATVSEISKECKWLHTVMPTTPIAASPTKSFSEEIQYASDSLESEATYLDDIAFWVYTSGTTGFPKACMHMHKAPIFCCKTFADQVLTLNEEDVIFSTISLYGSQGMVNSIFFPLWSGATSILLSKEPTTEDLIELIKTHQPTIFFSNPHLYDAILRESISEGVESLPSLRRCIASGQTLSPTLETNWKKHFDLDILSGLGCTEALYMFVCNVSNQIRPGSIGKAVPGYSLRLEDSSGQPVVPGAIGNLLVYGDSIAWGYWGNHKRTMRTMAGPWLVTGDKCIQDEEGFLYFAGRTEDMIFVSGQWVSPHEVEIILAALPQVSQVAIVGALDDKEQTRLRAYIVLQPNLEPSLELANELRISANENQPISKQVKWIEFVPDLPRSSNGKLQRYKLK